MWSKSPLAAATSQTNVEAIVVIYVGIARAMRDIARRLNNDRSSFNSNSADAPEAACFTTSGACPIHQTISVDSTSSYESNYLEAFFVVPEALFAMQVSNRTCLFELLSICRRGVVVKLWMVLYREVIGMRCQQRADMRATQSRAALRQHAI